MPKKQDWSPRIAEAARTMAPYLAARIQELVNGQRELTDYGGDAKDFIQWVADTPMDRDIMTGIGWNSGYLQALLSMVDEFQVELPKDLITLARRFIYEN